MFDNRYNKYIILLFIVLTCIFLLHALGASTREGFQSSVDASTASFKSVSVNEANINRVETDQLASDTITAKQVTASKNIDNMILQANNLDATSITTGNTSAYNIYADKVCFDNNCMDAKTYRDFRARNSVKQVYAPDEKSVRVNLTNGSYTIPLQYGSQGPQGYQGPTGDMGPVGEEGPQGPQGLQGTQGIGVSYIKDIKAGTKNNLIITLKNNETFNVPLNFRPEYIKEVVYDKDRNIMKFIKNDNTEQTTYIPMLKSIIPNQDSVTVTTNSGFKKTINLSSIKSIERTNDNKVAFKMTDGNTITTATSFPIINTVKRNGNNIVFTDNYDNVIPSRVTMPPPGESAKINRATIRNNKFVFILNDGQEVSTEISPPSCITDITTALLANGSSSMSLVVS